MTEESNEKQPAKDKAAKKPVPKKVDDVKVAALEKKVKHIHLRVIIQIRNELSAEQRKIAAIFKRNPSAM